MRKAVCIILAACVLFCAVFTFGADAFDISVLKQRPAFSYTDISNSDWFYGQYADKTLADGTFVEMLAAEWGNNAGITDYPKFLVCVTSKAGKEIVVQSGTFIIDGNIYELSFIKIDLDPGQGAMFHMTGDALPFMKSLAAAKSISAILRHTDGIVHVSFNAGELEGIRLFAQDLLCIDYLAHIADSESRYEDLYRFTTPLTAYVFDETVWEYWEETPAKMNEPGSDTQTRYGEPEQSDSGAMRVFDLPAGPFSVTLDESRYNILFAGMSESEPAAVRSGFNAIDFDFYMKPSNYALLMYDINARFPADFQIMIRIKDQKYPGMDTRRDPPAQTTAFFNAVYSGFPGTSGASGKEIVTVNGVPYLKFSWMNGTELRYATVINEDMIYIWVSRRNGKVTEEDAALLREVVESIRYPD